MSGKPRTAHPSQALEFISPQPPDAHRPQNLPPQPRTLTTDERGNFAAADLDPWGWLIEITALGYIPSSSHTFLISSGQTEEFNVQLWRKPPPIPIFSEFAKGLITLNAGALVLMATFVTQAQLTTPQSQLAQFALVFFMNGLVTSLAAFAVALTREHDRRLRNSTTARYTAFTLWAIAWLLFGAGVLHLYLLAMSMLKHSAATPLPSPW